jgi:hypothetical protein
MLFMEIALYSGNHMKHVNGMCGQNSSFNGKSGGTYIYHYTLNG